MKNFIILLFVLGLMTGCKNCGNLFDRISPHPDVSDLEMTAELKEAIAERRKTLLAEIDNGIIMLRSDYGYDGGRHEYRAADNFFYLTGINQPGSAIVLDKGNSGLYTLLIRKRTIREEIYDGEISRPEILMEKFLADRVLEMERLDEIIEESIKAGVPLYIDFIDSDFKNRLKNTFNRLKAPESLIRDIAPAIHEMRVIKDDTELNRIRKAVDITGEAFVNVCSTCRPGLYEFEIEALIEFVFRKNGAAMPAFNSIVGSGPNSVTLHYSANNRRMEDGDLLLMDTGAEYGNYCADITRTIPVNGKFTPEQKEIYSLVLKSQKAAIAELIPGKPLIEGQNRYRETVIRGLHELGLITDPESEWQKKFYIIHGTSHYIGLNVHDVGDYGAPDSAFTRNAANTTSGSRLLEKGMVLTVEPGIYLRSNGLSQLFEMYGREVPEEEIRKFIDDVSPVYEKYKNTGVRIEDDVLITETGNIVLSQNIPKEIDEIEMIMRIGSR